MDAQTIKAAVRERYAGFVVHSLPGFPAARTPPDPQAEPQQSCCSVSSSCCTAGNASLDLGYDAQDLTAVPEGANLGLGCGNPVALAALKPGETVLTLGPARVSMPSWPRGAWARAVVSSVWT